MYIQLSRCALGALSSALLIVAGSPASAADKPAPVGYTDTPVIPGSTWRVHDIARAHPRVVTPGAACGEAPSDAVMLFDGTRLDAWKGSRPIKKAGKVVGHEETDARWKVTEGYMEVNGTGAIKTRDAFGSCQMHVEWASPAEVKGASQGRGNSGIFLMGRYEVQVLDSFDNKSYADGQAGSIYGQWPPLVNASRKPGAWQTYDIVFEAPVFDGNKLVSPAYLTLIHNGVLLHNRKAMLGPTMHKRNTQYRPHPDRLPISLQDHNNPVRFRNIWIRPLTGYDEGK